MVISSGLKPGGQASTAMAAAALAAAMAENAAFKIYHRPTLIRPADLAVKSSRKTSHELTEAPPLPIDGRSKFNRRKSELYTSKRASWQQGRRSSLFVSLDPSLDSGLKSEAIVSGATGGIGSIGLLCSENTSGRQRLSSIISIEDEDQEMLPLDNNKTGSIHSVM